MLDIQEEKLQNVLESLPGMELKDIAEQLVSLSNGAGAIIISLAEDLTPLHGLHCYIDNKTTATKSVSLDASIKAAPKGDFLDIRALHIDDVAYEKQYVLSARQLYCPDYNLVGCIVVFNDRQQFSAPLVEAALNIAAERLTFALKQYLHGDCPVLHTNAKLNRKLDLLNEIGSISKTGGWEVELNTGKIVWTDEMYALYGLPVGTPITMQSSMAYFPVESRKAIEEAFNRVIKEGKEYCHEGFLIRLDGQPIRVKATGKARYKSGRVTHIYGALEDITEAYRLLETEHNYTAYLAAILDNLNDAVVTIDITGNIITANKSLTSVFGYLPEEVVGRDVKLLMPEAYSKFHSDYIRHYVDTGHAKIIGIGREVTGKHKNGKEFPIELSISEVIQDGQRQFIGIVKDITERKKAVEDTYKAAYFDSLTKLPNMRSFEKDLERVIQQASSQYRQLDIYCCLIDMDNFTQYNLSFGKHVGDAILRTLGLRLNKVLPEGLTLYRGIGDNFMILSTTPIENDAKQLNLILDSLEWECHKQISAPLTISKLVHNVTAAIASCRLDAKKASNEKINGVLTFGKKRAKKQGPGGMVALDKTAFDDYDRYQEISHSFTRALEEREFYLMLQPQYDGNQQIISSEALIRWEHPQLGFVSPAEFIPVAEESDAIIDIGNWVIEDACRMLRACLDQGLRTRIAVNISGRHIVRADFAKQLLEMVNKWRVSPDMLMLEITETTLISSVELVRERMESLGHEGFSFSIDDFGTGYSSLSYLKELPISELKIDRYFVDEITFQDESVPIVDSIVDLAHALNVSTVAEGIETEFQWDYLKQRGCNYFQGFYFSKPLPEKNWFDLVLQHKK